MNIGARSGWVANRLGETFAVTGRKRRPGARWARLSRIQTQRGDEEQLTMNNVKVFVLMAGLTSLFVAIGGYFGGQTGMLMAFVFAGLMNFVMYYGSSKMVLRMYGAQVVTERE